MRRPRQHEVETASRRLFEQTLSDACVFRPVGMSDYGIDGEVEAFAKGQTTGAIFKVQLKGTDSPDLSADGRIVACPLRVQNLKYYCHELRVPVIVILTDVSSKRVWWYAPQADPELKSRLPDALHKGQDTLVLHIPVTNVLPSTFNGLWRAVEESELAISTDTITATSFAKFYSTAPSTGYLDKVLGGMARGLAALQVKKLEGLWQRGRLADASKEIECILGNESGPVEAKVAACQFAEKMVSKLLPQSESQERERVVYSIALKIKRLCSKGPAHLKLYAGLHYRCAQLRILTSRDYMLFLSWRVETAPENADWADPLWGAMLAQQRRITAQKIVRKYNQCMRLLALAGDGGHFHIIPLSAAEVTSAMGVFLLRIRSEGLHDCHAIYKEHLEKVILYALDLAEKLEQWEDVALLCSHLLLVTAGSAPDDIEAGMARAKERVSTIQPESVRGLALQALEQMRDSLLKKDTEPVEDLDLERELYVKMAEGVGIDVKDPKNDIDRIVKIGLDDLNPERVLRTGFITVF